jgi:hypothetical protein
MDASIIYIGSHNVIELTSLTNTETDESIDDADVTVTIVDDRGQEVDGEVWPVTMSVDSAGRYSATLPADLAIEPHKHYVATITATAPNAIIKVFKRQLIAKYDT